MLLHLSTVKILKYYLFPPIAINRDPIFHIPLFSKRKERDILKSQDRLTAMT